ncbi:MAG TPA: hypothetical protein VMD30_02395 [Tepidisphaeraceae bacterium]|nr:hypothetical protein [Tepidisphaeraceae bacterium]
MKRSSTCGVVCEPIESRTLLSASPATIQTDVATLAADAKTLRQAATTAVDDLIVTVPAGTPGLAHLETLINSFAATSKSYAAGIKTDLVTVLADQGTGAESGALATLDTEVITARAALKPIWIKIVDSFAKHEVTFESYDTHLVGDYNVIVTDWDTVKTDFKTLKTDLS